MGKALHRPGGNVITRFRSRPQRNLHLSPELLSELRQGLYEASHGASGTSTLGVRRFLPAVAGKTGTADAADQLHSPRPPNAWYASFAPYNNPKLVVVALIKTAATAASPRRPPRCRCSRPTSTSTQQLLHVVGHDHVPLMRHYLRQLDC